LMMKGEVTCTAAIAALVLRIVLRSTDQGRCGLPMLVLPDNMNQTI
jgi:hypothetical protein